MGIHLKALSLSTIMLIGPNSEALLSNTAFYDMNHHGYHCLKFQQKGQIFIIHEPHEVYNQVCSVSYKKNQERERILWQHQRNSETCEVRAKQMALRLKDRGWQCQMTGI